MKSLADLSTKEKCVVQEVRGHGMIRRRMFDMGITPGCEIYVRKVAPLGDPICLSLRGYELSIRKEEAKNIIIDEIESAVPERIAKIYSN